jgi:hypothetical protein
MEQLPVKKRVSLRGPHGLGKTADAAIIILWFALTRDGEDWKIPTTASAWRQLTKFLWPEVHKWYRRLKWDLIGRLPFNERVELQDYSLKLASGEAFALASDNAAALEGAHADHLLYIFDEAKTIPPETWDAAEGAFSTPGEVLALAISTPGEPSGRFYQIHKREAGYVDWWVRHVTTEEAIDAGRVSPVWAEARRLQWGEQSAVYQNRVAGEFAASDEDGIIPLAWVERAVQRWQEINDANGFGDITRLGADIGRGGDPSVIARRHGWAIKEFEEITERDVMGVTGRINGIMQAHPKIQTVVDVVGIGAGVVDRLREVRKLYGRVLAFNAAGASEEKDKTKELGFINCRAEAWWTVRELLQDDMIALPPEDLLIGDLTAPKWHVQSGGKIQVEKKEDVRERLGRSTDYGDAVIMAFWKKTGGASMDEIEKWGQEIDESEIPPDLLAYMKGSQP